MAQQHLYGLVDMGSNGIRFSITNLAPPTTRSLPTVFQSRLGVSLYDAQYRESAPGIRSPIPPDVISTVISALLRFKSICRDFEVPDPHNITVLATEATRTAVNAKDFLEEIKGKTGWDVKLLAKEEEGRVGAMGIASSDDKLEGLVMDLGGGSTQITWMISRDGQVQTSPKGSFSFPYGAAALTRRLAELEKQGSQAREALASEIQTNFRNAFRDLEIPPELTKKAEAHGGFTLYLSGGGFRGWGYLLMSQSPISPYPIPIINGYRVPISQFQNTTHLQSIAFASLSTEDPNPTKIFRVSKRRATQVPAVAFLINNLLAALPSISTIQFCQGGVREGYLYAAYLPPSIRSESPLTAATAPYATPLSPLIHHLLLSSLPHSSQSPSPLSSPPATLTPTILLSLTHLLYHHTTFSPETAPLSALSLPLTGPLSSTHGITHHTRALLSLMLHERWGSGDSLPPPYTALKLSLESLLSGPEEVWWVRFLGRVAGLIACVWPAAGTRTANTTNTNINTTASSDDNRIVSISSKYILKPGNKKEKYTLQLTIITLSSSSSSESTAFYDGGIDGIDEIREKASWIEKLGKKKNRIVTERGENGGGGGGGGGGGEKGFDVVVEVVTQSQCQS